LQNRRRYACHSVSGQQLACRCCAAGPGPCPRGRVQDQKGL